MVDEQVNIDLTQALAAVDQLVARLAEAGARGGQAIAEEITTRLADINAQVNVAVADAAAITGEVDEALGAVSGEVAVGLADSAALAGEIDAAVASASPEAIDVDADASQLIDGIEGAVASVRPDAIEVEADTLQLVDGIAGAVAGVDLPAVPVDGDPSALIDGITGAVASIQPDPIPVDADPSQMVQQVEDAVASVDPVPIELEVDPSLLVSQIEDVVATASPDPIDVEFNVTGAEDAEEAGQSLSNVADKANTATGSLTTLGSAATVVSGAVSTATVDFRGAASAAGSMSPAFSAAAAGVVGLVGALGSMVGQAAQAQNAARLMDNAFGSLRPTIESIDIGGLSESLSELAVRMGSDDDAIRVVIARFGQMALQSGATAGEVDRFTDSMVALAARAVALNPSLGTVQDVLQRMPQALANGGRFAVQLGLDLNSADIAAEALAQGIEKPISELTLLERAMLGAAVSTRQLGNSLGEDINSGAASASLQFRAFRQSLQEEMEAAGAALLPLAVQLSQDLQPVLANLVQLIGQVGQTILAVLGPALAAIGPPVADLLESVGGALETLQPLFELVGAILGKVLPIVVDIGIELFKWTTPLGLALQVLNKINEHGERLERAFTGAGESLDEVGRRLGVDPLVQQRRGLTDFVSLIKDAEAGAALAGVSLETWARAAQRAGVEVDDVATVTAALNLQHQTQVEVVGTLGEAYADYAIAQEGAAGSTGSLSAAISESNLSLRDAAAQLFELRGNADTAFFALLKLGSDGGRLVDELAASFSRGGLSMDEFKATAQRFGLTLEDLAAVEARVREESDRTAEIIAARGEEVEQALGGMTDATAKLDDEGKSHIDAFATQVEQRLQAAADFSGHIAELFEANAPRVAQAFLEAGPESAGALEELTARGTPAIAELEARLVSASDTAEREKDRAVKAAQDQARGMTDALENIKPDEATIENNIDLALNAATAAVLDAKPDAFDAGFQVGEATADGVSAGMNAGLENVRAAAGELIDVALLAAQSAGQIGSPSRLFANEIGAPLVDGIVEGIRVKAGESGGPIYGVLQRAVEEPAGRLAGTVGKGGETIGFKVIEGVADGIAEAAPAVDSALVAVAGSAGPAVSRLFSQDVGIPLTQAIAEGIRAGAFHVDDAVADVIEATQQRAQQELQNVFSALQAGRSVDQAQERLNDLTQQRSELLALQADLPRQMGNAQKELNAALVESEAITAREQQAIERAQANLDRIRAELTAQATTGPQQLDEAQRVLTLDRAELDRLRSIAQQRASEALLGTATSQQAQAAQAAFDAQKRTVDQSQQAVDRLTQTLRNNRLTQTNLNVAIEDLADAQARATEPTQRLTEAQRALEELEQEAAQTKRDLLDITKQMPDAQIALLQATARAAIAGEVFNQQGLRGMDILAGIGRQAGFADEQLAELSRTWAGLASTIATNLGGGAFGAPAGQVDIGSILGTGTRFTDPTSALNELNFVRGLAGEQGLTQQQAPWNINIYQANDPAILAGTIDAIKGLAGVR